MTVIALPLDPPADTQLGTQRTVARHLVHRAALAEVFLTDFRSVDDRSFHAAAQLPPSHGYYGDHTGIPRLHDPLAAFESVRQMLLCAMHLQHQAGPDTKSITATADLEITDPRPLRATGGPLDLRLLGETLLAKEYHGAISRVVHRVRVLVGDRQVGTVTVDTAQRPDQVYQSLRMSHRSSLPPSSDTLSGYPAGEPVAPYLVGRERSANVVVQDVRAQGGALVARLHVPVAHPSMFDHPQDHVPGPVMMEAARQTSLLLAGDRLGLSASRLFLQGAGAQYLRFAELDSDITLRTTALEDEPGTAVATAVDFEQGGEAVARIRVRLGSTVGLPEPQLPDGGPSDRRRGVRDAL